MFSNSVQSKKLLPAFTCHSGPENLMYRLCANSRPKRLEIEQPHSFITWLIDTEDARCSFLVRLPLRPTPRDHRSIRPGIRPESSSETQPGTDPVADPVDRVVLTLAPGPLAPSALQERLGLKHRPTFRKNYLHPALEAGFVEPTIPNKSTSRLQKYTLTEQGRALLDELNHSRNNG